MTDGEDRLSRFLMAHARCVPPPHVPAPTEADLRPPHGYVMYLVCVGCGTATSETFAWESDGLSP
jgi:hypothetical protein